MLMHTIAHAGCTDTIRESALEVDSGRKIPCHTRDLNSHQYCAWLFSRTLYQLSSSCPFMLFLMMVLLFQAVVEKAVSWDRNGDGLIENSGFADQTFAAWVMAGSRYVHGTPVSK